MVARAILLGLLLLLAPEAASALSCSASPSLLGHAQTANLVVVATVTDSDDEKIIVRVDRVLKGETPKRSLKIASSDWGPNPRRFGIGTSWVFALYRFEEEYLFSLCGRGWARHESGTAVGEITRCNQTSVRALSGGGVLATNEPERMSIDRLEAAIRSGVALPCVRRRLALELPEPGGSKRVTGVVLDSTGRPAAGRTVVVRSWATSLEDSFGGSARTDTDGRFAIKNVPRVDLLVYLYESQETMFYAPPRTTELKIIELSPP